MINTIKCLVDVTLESACVHARDYPCDIILVALKFVISGPDPNMCNCRGNVCNQYLKYCFLSLRGKLCDSVHN